MPGRHIWEHRNSSTILDLGTRWRWLVSLVPRCFAPGKMAMAPIQYDAVWAPELIWMPYRRTKTCPCWERVCQSSPYPVTTLTDNAVVTGNINNSLFSLHKTYSAPSLIHPFTSFSHKHITMAQNCAAVYHLHTSSALQNWRLCRLFQTYLPNTWKSFSKSYYFS
jgi:hypothetical protein